MRTRRIGPKPDVNALINEINAADGSDPGKVVGLARSGGDAAPRRDGIRLRCEGRASPGTLLERDTDDQADREVGALLTAGVLELSPLYPLYRSM
jgi:hypothetical protein